MGLDPRFQSHICVFRPFFFQRVNSNIIWIYCIGDKNTVYILFMDLIILFTHLKIILLPYFHSSVSTKISCIQTDSILHVFSYVFVTYISKNNWKLCFKSTKQTGLNISAHCFYRQTVHTLCSKIVASSYHNLSSINIAIQRE